MGNQSYRYAFLGRRGRDSGFEGKRRTNFLSGDFRREGENRASSEGGGIGLGRRLAQRKARFVDKRGKRKGDLFSFSEKEKKRKRG